MDYDYKQKTKELKKAIKELRYINPYKKAFQIDPEEICRRFLEKLRHRFERKWHINNNQSNLLK